MLETLLWSSLQGITRLFWNSPFCCYHLRLKSYVMFPETPPAEGNKVLLLPNMTHFNCSLFPSPCPIHPSQEACARSDTSVGKRQLFVNTGYEDCAKRETSASSCTNMTWPRCLSVTSTPNLVSSSCLTFLAGVGDWRRSWCIPLIHPQSITFFCVWC